MRLPRPLTFLAAACLAATAAAGPLQRYNVDPATVTVSGISSGGAMAVQAHVAYSATFRGAAIFAGAAYYCAQGNVALAIGRCQEALTAAEIPVAQLVATTRDWASRGWIDDPARLAAHRVYLFGGTLDQTVRQPGMDALRDYYQAFLPASQVAYVNNVAAGHGWISPLGQVTCALQQSPFVNNCLIDPQQAFLTMFYGALQPRQSGALTGTLQPVDQGEFLDDRNPALHSLDANAWAYVPAACERGEPCRLHVSFHGCNQGYAKVGDAFLRQANLNEWADSNRIVVLYPQAVATPPTNGLGCWDWWGYDNADYAKKHAPQMLMAKRMVDRVTAGHAPVAAPAGLTAVRVSPNSVRLAWSGVVGATGYRVYRNDVALTPQAVAEADFTDKTVARDSTYSYTVRALAPNGNLGPASQPATVAVR
jgi:poly(3-hydroxybutyrate) depolymerase